MSSLKIPDSKELVEKFAKRAVEAALAGLDDSRDRNDQIAIEAVDALDRLASVADKELLGEILPTLLLKIRPCFEKVSGGWRDQEPTELQMLFFKRPRWPVTDSIDPYQALFLKRATSL